MDFSLDDELIEQIIFAMEDQQHNYYAHRHSGELVREEEIEEDYGQKGIEDPFVPIPEWQPVHGFLLMEKFVARLRNPLLREQLKDALASGRGVFRKFKDILKTSRGAEHGWYTFKERELRQVVRQWYNEQRELAGLDRLKEEPEETDGLEALLGSDFSILPVRERHLEAVRELDEAAFIARFPDADARRAADFWRESRASLPDLPAKDSLLLVAETAEQDFAGFVWAVENTDALVPGRILQVHQLAVVQHYQGMGLGTMLLKRIIAEARDRGFHRVRSELSGKGLQLAGFFRELGFQPYAQVMDLDPTNWDE
jgi:GNAT superfamily N-acetyltransferase